MKKEYNLIVDFPAGVQRDYIKTKFFHVRTPDGEVRVDDVSYTRRRGDNIAACFYAVEEDGELTFLYYTSLVVGRWPFNCRSIGGGNEVVAKFRSVGDGVWQPVNIESADF